jgi:hypothetical protein
MSSISPPQSPHQPLPQDDFYVGYLPTPRSHRAVLRVLVPSLLLLLLLTASLIALAQRDPGPGLWRDTPETFRGTMLASPAPMLLVQDASSASPRLILLVEEGKHGSQSRAKAWDGQQVSVTGRILTRGDLDVLEVLAGDSAVRTDDASRHLSPPPAISTSDAIAPSPQTLRGEIIDPKCFHGAMKPGDGKGHKACATLCIRNGIPPMLLCMDEAGKPMLYLLARSSGATLDEQTLSMVGEPIELTGEVTTLANLRLLTMIPGSARRLQP